MKDNNIKKMCGICPAAQNIRKRGWKQMKWMIYHAAKPHVLYTDALIGFTSERQAEVHWELWLAFANGERQLNVWFTPDEMKVKPSSDP